MNNGVRCFLTALLTGILVMSIGLFEPISIQLNPKTVYISPQETNLSTEPLTPEIIINKDFEPPQIELKVDPIPNDKVDNKVNVKELIGAGEALAAGLDEPILSDPPKIAYLTFDDGPSEAITPKILDTLNEYQVKATFFVIGSWAKRNPELIQRAVKEGHAIGNHTYSHQYKNVYRNTDNFMNEVNACEDVLTEIIGLKPTIFRAPGGSNLYLTDNYIDRLIEANYQYYDWNVCPGDATPIPKSARTLVDIAIRQARDKTRIIVLLHDAPNMRSTAEALPDIIKGLKNMGFSFEVITPETEPIQFNHKHGF